MTPTQQTVEHAKQVIDAASVGVVAGALTGLLPAIAAGFTIIWTGIRIWESKTVQNWINRRKGD